jgi:hypothetical protein
VVIGGGSSGICSRQADTDEFEDGFAGPIQWRASSLIGIKSSGAKTGKKKPIPMIGGFEGA